MPLLFPKLRVTQVFGANTDVGKTLLTTALLRSTAALYQAEESQIPNGAERKQVYYLKPVSTGSADEADDGYVESFSNKSRRALIGDRHRYVKRTIGSGKHSWASKISTKCVLCLRDPYYRNEDFLAPYFRDRGIDFWTFEKPHEKRAAKNREEDVRMLDEYYLKLDRGNDVGEPTMRDVATVLERQHFERIEELESMPKRTLDQVWWPFTQHGIVSRMCGTHDYHLAHLCDSCKVNKEENVMVIDSAKGDYFDAFYKPAQESRKPEKGDSSLLNPLFDGSASWFTQAHTHGNPELTLAAAEAAGRYGHVLFPSGTNAPALTLAEKLLQTIGQGWASRVFYSDNGSTGMEVALKMALRAAGKRYGWQGVNGHEVGVIGLKGGYHGDTIGSMDAADQGIFNTAVDWYRGRGHWFSPPAVTVQNGEILVSSIEAENWPSHPMKDGLTATEDAASKQDHWSVKFGSLAEVYDVESRLQSDLAKYYTQHIRETLEKVTAETDPITQEKRRFGALVLEPICLGAGGMVFVDPLFQRCLMDVVRASGDLFGDGAEPVPNDNWQGLPVVFDEGMQSKFRTHRHHKADMHLSLVFSGIHRLSYLTASTILGSTPDIATYAKILTGGLLPLSVTLASNSIFEAFYHPERKVDALLHGHSYTANPIGCNVALKALQLIDKKEKETDGNWVEAKQEWGVEAIGDRQDLSGQLWSLWSKQFIGDISRSPRVKSTMAMGTVLAIELQEPENAQFSGELL
ncbi:hypothetical protein QFC19_008321 [Naganishia cerealis]|uniref:Uncharacterized protein n=1 Tax=Naganishia cerealis TaxID=610337 RepID=A0ACC2V372_9TREE|nr:hypothetical protein QFC19_008321 [Naganishia cerealis]